MDVNEVSQPLGHKTINHLPDEVLGRILWHSSTPTLFNLIAASKRLFFDVASHDRRLILDRLQHLPGDKQDLAEQTTEQLFLLLRQRCVNSLCGAKFTANMLEYINPNVSVVPDLCAISGLDADYVRMAIVTKHTNDIRQYTNHCQIKEKIALPAGSRLLKLVQWGRVISVLCVLNEDEADPSEEELDSDDSESETEMLNTPDYSPSANIRLSKYQKNLNKYPDAKVPFHVSRSKPIKKDSRIFRITHFDVYTMEDSVTYSIPGTSGYIPRDFAVHSQEQCAVLWDRENSSGRPTEDAFVMAYRYFEDSSVDDDDSPYLSYDATKIWPKRKDNSRHEDSDTDDPPDHLAARIAFFKDGRRMKVYETGGTVPFEVFSTTARGDSYNYMSTNQVAFEQFTFHVDTPFYGTHSTFYDDEYQEKYCFLTHLCLGVTNMALGTDEDARVLCILRAQTRYYPSDCNHGVALTRMAHVSAGTATVVARLWGWGERYSTLAARDTLAISPGATRIAIAMWDKVYVYPLNPRILCQETVHNSDDESTPRARKKKRKYNKPWESKASDYYRRKKDPNLMNWKIVDLKPIVLDLKGAVAHKLSWSNTKGEITDTIMPEVEVPPSPTETEIFTFDDHSALPQDPTDDAATVVEPIAATPTVANEADDIETQPQAVDETNAVSADLEAASAIEEDSNHQQSTVADATNTPSQSSENAHLIAETPSLGVDAQMEEPPSVDGQEPKGDQPNTAPVEGIASITDSQSTPILQPAMQTSPPADPVPSLSSAFSTLTLTPTTTFPNTNAITPVEQPTTKVLPRKDKGIDHKSEFKKQPSVAASAYKLMSPANAALWNKEPSKSTPSVAQILGTAIAATPAASLVEPLKTDEQTKAEVVGEALKEEPSKEAIAEEAKAMAVREEIDIGNLAKDDLSKASTDSSISVPEEPVSTEQAPVEDGATVEGDANAIEAADVTEQKTVRSKRITEDELIILTDRGIQIWNLGATAKGARKRKFLPLEESLQGKLPAMKGKTRSTE